MLIISGYSELSKRKKSSYTKNSSIRLLSQFKITCKRWTISFKVKFYFMRRVSARETRCWQNKCRAFTESKVITEKKLVLAKTAIFRVVTLWRPNLWSKSNLTTPWGKSVNRTIECVFPRRCSPFGYRVMCRFVQKNVENGKILPLVTYGDPTFDLN